MMTTTRRPVERSGLRKRPQMEQIVHYLAMHQEKIKFPDRTAIFIRNHPYMTQLDFFDMQEAQEIQWEEQQQQHNALEAARQMGLGVAEAEARQHNRRQGRNAGYYGGGVNWDDYGRDNWGGGGGYGGGPYGGGRGANHGREDVGDDFYERMRQEAADIRQNQRAIQEDARQQLRQHHGTMQMMHDPANQARASGSGLTPEQRRAGQMAQQGPLALPAPTDPPMIPYYPQGPVNVPTGVAQTVHIMGRGENSMFVPPQRPRRDPPLPPNQPVQPIPSLPTPEPRRARSHSGGRRRWDSEGGNPFARVALAPRRGGLGDTPFVLVAPTAPKMAPRPVDPVPPQEEEPPPMTRPSRAAPIAKGKLPYPKPARLGSVPEKRDRSWPSPERRQKPRPSLRSDIPRHKFK